MADRRRIAAALEYLGAMRDRAAEFGSGVAGTLANRARDVGGMAYEALTSDPNIGRMNTAEFAQAAASRAPTPRLDAAGQGAVELGRAVLTQPVQTGKALVQGEVDRARQAMTSPRAAGEYAGSMVDPLRLASALRRGPMLELDVYHGTPHRFEPTEANPLGELDASKIGTGEGAQAYGHGVYLAESPNVARNYQNTLSKYGELRFSDGTTVNVNDLPYGSAQQIAGQIWINQHRGTKPSLTDAKFALQNLDPKYLSANKSEILKELEKLDSSKAALSGHLYTLDLPDDMIDRMLDWDKPLSEQPENVKKALLSNKEFNRRIATAIDSYGADKVTGGNIHSMLSGKPGEIERALAEMGIPGVRYLDAGSRGGDSATGTRNFVVFPGEEKKVKVLRRE